MDQLIKETANAATLVNPISAADLLIALLSSALFNIALAKTYITTHSGYSYSKSYVHSLVFVGITVALIMVIIGSNIARAFALVGAMSIVRFRNPVKDSRDLVFIFMAIAIGMACGTRFYLFAGIFMLISITLMLGFHYTHFGDLTTKGYVLRIRTKSDERDQLTEICREYCRQYSVVSVDRTPDQAGYDDVIYEIELKRNTSYDDLVNRISEKLRSASVSLLVGESGINA